MPREFTPKVITANALSEGAAVYLTEHDVWTPNPGEAEILTDEADAELRLLIAQARASTVVNARLTSIPAAVHGMPNRQYAEPAEA